MAFRMVWRPPFSPRRSTPSVFYQDDVYRLISSDQARIARSLYHNNNENEILTCEMNNQIDTFISMLHEMFPNFSDHEIRNIVANFSPSQQQSFDQLVDQMLLESQKRQINPTQKLIDNAIIVDDEDNDAIMDMISLEPSQFSEENKNTTETDNGTDKKRKQTTNNQENVDNNSSVPSRQAITLSYTEQMKQIREQRQQEWKVTNKPKTTTLASSSKKSAEELQAEAEKKAQASLSQYNQLQQIRFRQNNKWRSTKFGQKRIWTAADFEANQKAAKETQAEWGGVGGIRGSSQAIAIGKRALELTNEFRRKNGLPSLKWHQTLCDIGTQHSKDMGEGKVPFGHQGFNERVKQYPFHAKSAAENVAMNHGLHDVAKVAVDGWIDSPGHRKNMLSNSEYCGIGVYQNSSGAWYLTQLFGTS